MYVLSLTAELNGVTDLAPVDTQTEPFYFTFKVQCTSCRETHPNWVTISRFEQNEISGSRGEANFVWRCKNCRRESTASIRAAPKPYYAESPPTRQDVIEFDTRGLEFTEFNHEGIWSAKGIDSGTKFSEITFEDGEWYDVDDKTKDEVSITELKWEIRRG